MVNVGIDVSKEISIVCMLCPYGDIVQSPFEVEHTEENLLMLVEKM